MQHISDWNELRDKIHANAVEHGFWENNPSPEHFLCLVISELMESVEAHRKSKHADLNSFEKRIDEPISKHEAATPVERLRYWFNSYIKDSVEDELADAIIRILDLAGAHNVNMNLRDVTRPMFPENGSRYTENIYQIVQTLVRDSVPLDVALNACRMQICKLAESMGINIAWHIEKKMIYNASRSYKHGKNY